MKDKYLDLARELKKNMEHESDSDTNCNCKYNHLRIDKGFVCLFEFYGIPTSVGYLMPNPFLLK